MELKDILTFTGIEADNIEDFKTNFEKTFLKKDAALKDKEFVNSLVGKRLNGVANKLKNVLVKYGVEISDADAKEKPLEELIETGFEKYNEATTGTINELTEKVNKNSGEQVKELNDKYLKLENKLKDTKSALDKTVSEYDQFKLASAENLKGVKLKTVKEQNLSRIPRRTDIEEKQYNLMWRGFESMLDTKYKHDLDEEGKEFIADSKTGQRIPNPSKASEFLTVEEVYRKEADEAGLTPKNPFKPPAPRPQPPLNGGGNPTPPAINERPMAAKKAITA